MMTTPSTALLKNLLGDTRYKATVASVMENPIPVSTPDKTLTDELVTDETVATGSVLSRLTGIPDNNPIHVPVAAPIKRPSPVQPVPADAMEGAIWTLAQYARDHMHHHRMKELLIQTGVWAALRLPPPVMKKDGPPPSCPPIDEITCIQIAIFDNWPDGRPVSRNPNRYGAAIEVWTKPGSEIVLEKGRINYDFKSQVSMMDDRALKNMIKVLRKPRITPISPDYIDVLMTMLDAVKEEQLLIGLLNTNIRDDDQEYGRGTWYHENQFVIMRMDGGRIEWCKLFSDGKTLDLAPFDDKDKSGRKHGGKVVLQSRHAITDIDDADWPTNKPE